MSRQMDVELELERAKGLLRETLTFEAFAPWLSAKGILRQAKSERIPKVAVKLARRELGVLSVTGPDGEQYWALPERIGLPTEGL